MTGQGRTRALAGGAFMVLALGAGAGVLPSTASAAESNGTNSFAKAFQSTVATKSSDVSLVVSSSAAGQTVKVGGKGAFDYANNDGRLTLRIGILGQSLTLKERLVNGNVYVSLPAEYRSVLKVSKPWIDVPLGASSTSNPLGGENPTDALALLQTSTSGVTKVGPATIDGVSTTEYKATVNPSKELANEPPAVKKLTQGSLSQFSGLTSVPVTVWVDGQNRVRRLTENVTLNPTAGSAASSVGAVKATTTLNLSNFGVHVSVAPPPAGQVSHKSLSSLTGGGSI